MSKKNPFVGAIIQARTTSSRLPNKVMMALFKKPMVLRVIERTKKAKKIKQIILAIPEGRENDVLEYFARENKIECYRGSENDVLSRYYEAAKKYQIEVIVRITSDCPFIDPRIVDRVVKTHLSARRVDYTSNIIERTFPKGLDVEVFGFKALEKSFEEAQSNYDREHVDEYILNHPNLFKLQNVKARGALRRPELRLTVDIKEDFQMAEKVYHHFKDKMFYTRELIRFLDKHPEIKKINIETAICQP